MPSQSLSGMLEGRAGRYLRNTRGKKWVIAGKQVSIVGTTVGRCWKIRSKKYIRSGKCSWACCCLDAEAQSSEVATVMIDHKRRHRYSSTA